MESMDNFNNDNLIEEKFENMKKHYKHNTKILCLGISIASLCVGLIGGILIHDFMEGDTYNFSGKYKQCYEILDKYWLFGKTEEEITKATNELMYSGRTSTDAYTFITENQEDQGLSLSNVGFGIKMIYCPKGILLEEVYSNGVMAKLGAQKDDIITNISYEGKTYSLSNQKFSEISAILSESKKSNSVDFKLLRNGQSFEINNATADEFSQDAGSKISKYSNDKVLTIKLNTFLADSSTLNEEKNSAYSIVSDLLKEQDLTKLETLVLDLRNNTGGLLSQATDIANLFSPKNKYTVIQKDKNDNIIGINKQNDEPLYGNLKIKILQNGYSASASEALTLALKQNCNAQIYGFKSYGKGIAQSFYTFKDNSVMRFTISRVFGPDGKTCIHNVGIYPDFDSKDYGFKEYPYDYSGYAFTNENYQNYLKNIGSCLNYLNYDISSDPTNDEILSTINQFQQDYGYEVEEIYSDETSKELIYEVYKKSVAQEDSELKIVVEGN